MKHFKLLTLIFGLLLVNSNHAGNKIILTNKTSKLLAGEKEKLLKLAKQLYKWHETKSSQNDFEPMADNEDSSYIGLDLKKHEQRLTELKQTNFFSDQFLNNYNKIALKINEELKNKKIEWKIGELPPFGNDSNPWCNCQDSPNDYWNDMTINTIMLENKTATFTWTWGGITEYKIKAIKKSNIWKITYLQGFDFDKFISSN